MIKKYHRWRDRRQKSAVKPLLYLLLEAIALFLICVIAYYKLEFLILKVLVALGAIYFFIISSIKRYRIVRDRQKFYDE